MPFAEGMLRDFWGLKFPHAATQACQHLDYFEAKCKVCVDSFEIMLP